MAWIFADSGYYVSCGCGIDFELLLRQLHLREYIISTLYQATILSAGLPLIERWPFHGWCWYRFVLLLSASDFFGNMLLKFSNIVSKLSRQQDLNFCLLHFKFLLNPLYHILAGYYGRHKVPIEL